MNYKYYFNEYEVEIKTNSSGNNIKVKSKNNSPCNKFSSPETESKPKIYIIKSSNSIVYIGKTNQSITSRLRKGLNPNHSNGYHGYKWKNNENIKILCITIESDNEFGDIELESIEAELVYNYRNNTGSWPLSQTEIHFHNNERIKEFAQELFKKIIDKSSKNCT